MTAGRAVTQRALSVHTARAAGEESTERRAGQAAGGEREARHAAVSVRGEPAVACCARAGQGRRERESRRIIMGQ